jgi:hypothetical protein
LTETLVESADGPEDPRRTIRHAAVTRSSRIPVGRLAPETEWVPREAADADGDAGVLDTTVGVEQLRADGADLGTLRMLLEGTQPVGAAGLGVVVQEEQIAPGRVGDGEIVETREIERAGSAHDRVSALSEERERRLLAARCRRRGPRCRGDCPLDGRRGRRRSRAHPASG